MTINYSVSNQSDSQQSRVEFGMSTKSSRSDFVESSLRTKCILYRCCQSCSYCNYSRAAAKEKLKSRSCSEKNKVCQRCFLCKSLSFCPLCSKCPSCCHRDQCWGKASELLASLAKIGFKPQSSVSFERWLPTPLQGKATTQPLSLNCEQICKSPQMQGSFRSSGLSKAKTSRRKGGCQVFPGFLQSTFSVPKAQQQVASNLRPKQTQSFPGHKYFQDGNPRDYPVLSPKRGMGHVVGFQRRIFPHSHSPEVQEVPKISPKQGQLSVHIPSLWFGNGPVGIHQSGQGGQANGSSKGYQDPPVPRRLDVASPFPGNLPTRYPDHRGPLPRVGLDGKHGKVGTDSSAGFQLRRLLI